MMDKDSPRASKVSPREIKKVNEDLEKELLEEEQREKNRANAANVNKQRTFTPRATNEKMQDVADVDANEVLEYSQDISRAMIDNSSI